MALTRRNELLVPILKKPVQKSLLGALMNIHVKKTIIIIVIYTVIIVSPVSSMSNQTKISLRAVFLCMEKD